VAFSKRLFIFTLGRGLTAAGSGRPGTAGSAFGKKTLEAKIA